ncbi:carbohydrate ABC transporter permease [Lachnotalea sp. AF33-28]|uniref:carbohydrate ABC transporter permease n=1 Tax=Lachnotalea sp. AF33-28 TaxID=2292046 RepID=UPI000E50BF81|nr:carbohydrate ABC transporter permease [Lachnotalea sp. AF33-28]RHP31209.1 carbohydrate ABC transporter permease [Lachnotalea sp. AF33-28]
MEKNIEKRAANKAHKKLISADKTFDVANVVIMILLFFIFAWPLWFVVIASFSDPGEVWRGNVILFPKGFSIDSYTEILKYKEIWIGYRNTIFYTVVGTVINLFMTVCMAYPLSRKKFMPKNILMVLCMITMYFGGGLIPSYLVVKNLHMIDTVWAMMIPGCLSVYNMIIMRSYFVNSIPDSLEEAATLDGAGPVQYLVKVVLPLSKPVIAVIALYYMVGHWNDFFSALIYVNDKNLLPLQTFLRNLLVTNTVGNVSQTQNLNPELLQKKIYLAQTIKYSAIIVSTLPVLCIYPFVQKYFVKGVMIGAIKG